MSAVSPQIHPLFAIACEQAPKQGIGWNEKSLSEPDERDASRGKKEREGACGHSFNAAGLRYQILVSWFDWLDRWFLTALAVDTLNRLMSRGVHLHKLWSFFGLQFGEVEIEQSYPSNHWAYKRAELKIFLQSAAKKEDVFGILSDWFRQDFDLPGFSLRAKRNVEL